MINGIRLDDQNSGNYSLSEAQRNQIRSSENSSASKTVENGLVPAEEQATALETPSPAYGNAMYAIRTALYEAGLPVNERNQDVVRQMLDNQMGLSKDSLIRIISQTNVFREADISTLILMNKNNIPVTHFTAAQLQAYINNEQNMAGQIQDGINGLIEYLGDEAASGNVAPNISVLELLTAGDEVYTENMQALGNAANAINSANSLNTANAGSAVNAEAVNNAEIAETAGGIGEAVNAADIIGTGQDAVISSLMSGQGGTEAIYAAGQAGQAALQQDNAVLNMLETSAASNVVDKMGTDAEGSGANWMNGFGSDNEGLGDLNEYSTGKGSSGVLNNSAEQPETDQRGFTLSNFLKEEDIKELNTLRGEAFESAKPFEGNEDAKSILDQIYNEIKNQDPSDIQKLLGSEPYKKLIKGMLNEKFVLNEKDIDSADSINRYYKETYSALSKLSEIASKNEGLADKLQKPMDNIKFMDTLNNVFPYIQLPLKLNEGSTHGELYVFKKGRSRVSEGDSQSVLLHLDMDNLGSTDIHMELKAGFLKLNFYCNSEDSKELLSSHFSELESALSDKGFNVGSEFSVRTTDTVTIVEALSGSSGNVPEFKYNFDIRA